MINYNKLYNSVYLAIKKIKILFIESFGVLYIKIYLFFLFFLNFIIWIIAYNLYNNIGRDQMILHYSINFGVNLYGDAKKIFIIPLIGLIVIIVNFFLLILIGEYNEKDKNFISHILSVSAILVNIILFLSIIIIKLVNFR